MMPIRGSSRGILKKVHDSLLFHRKNSARLDQPPSISSASAINFATLCESFLRVLDDASQQRSESRILVSRLAYTVWKVSQDRRGRFVTETGGKKEAHSYEQLHSVELLLPVRFMTYDMIRHTAASLRCGADSAEALSRMFLSLPRREGGA